MSRARSIRNRKRRDKNKLFEIDITSLLDILVILLVFLLKSYNASGIQIEIPKDIKLPKSATQDLSTAGVMIQVTQTKIWVDSKKVLDASENPESKRIYDQGNRRIRPLYDELVKKIETIETLHKQLPDKAAKFSGVANLIVDKKVKYSYLKKIMYTTASAGFQQYKFVVLSDQE